MNIYGVELVEKEDSVVLSYKRKGFFEPESIDRWKAALVKGEIAIDVGAYTGIYSILASMGGIPVVAYEPNPVVRKRLEENIAINKATVVVNPCAAGAEKGSGVLWLQHGDMTSAGRLKKREGGVAIGVCIEPVKVEGKVCAVKIDAEGHELYVLKGMLPILEKDHPLVIAEALDEDIKSCLIRFMTPLGYSSSIADGRNIIFECVL